MNVLAALIVRLAFIPWKHKKLNEILQFFCRIFLFPLFLCKRGGGRKDESKQMKHAIAFASDFDNTLYFGAEKSGCRIEDREEIRRFQSAGNLFGISTGRSLRGIRHAAGDIPFDFYILTSGALVLDGDCQLIAASEVSTERLRQIYERYKADTLSVIHAAGGVYTFAAGNAMQEHIDTFDSLSGMAVYGMSFHVWTPEAAAAMAEQINAWCGGEIRAFQNVANVDIVADGVSKGAALQCVKAHYGVAETAAIGDSYNDIPMLQAAAKSFTFFDSPLQVRLAASHIVGSVSEALTICGGQ